MTELTTNPDLICEAEPVIDYTELYPEPEIVEGEIEGEYEESSPESEEALASYAPVAESSPEINFTPAESNYEESGPTLSSVEPFRPNLFTTSGLWTAVTHYTSQILDAAATRRAAEAAPRVVGYYDVAAQQTIPVAPPAETPVVVSILDAIGRLITTDVQYVDMPEEVIVAERRAPARSRSTARVSPSNRATVPGRPTPVRNEQPSEMAVAAVEPEEVSEHIIDENHDAACCPYCLEHAFDGGTTQIGAESQASSGSPTVPASSPADTNSGDSGQGGGSLLQTASTAEETGASSSPIAFSSTPPTVSSSNQNYGVVDEGGSVVSYGTPAGVPFVLTGEGSRTGTRSQGVPKVVLANGSPATVASAENLSSRAARHVIIGEDEVTERGRIGDKPVVAKAEAGRSPFLPDDEGTVRRNSSRLSSASFSPPGREAPNGEASRIRDALGLDPREINTAYASAGASTQAQLQGRRESGLTDADQPLVAQTLDAPLNDVPGSGDKGSDTDDRGRDRPVEGIYANADLMGEPVEEVLFADEITRSDWLPQADVVV